jgi:hypothetical protein
MGILYADSGLVAWDVREHNNRNKRLLFPLQLHSNAVISTNFKHPKYYQEGSFEHRVGEDVQMQNTNMEGRYEWAVRNLNLVPKRQLKL